jgi:predicted short-subunit dehydrogenase-like oxidoreductase (DUF2520 family)
MTSAVLLSRDVVVTVTVVGAGRLGKPVARALAAGGMRVNGPSARGQDIPPADVVLLCVPDAEIARVAESVGHGGGFVGHMSGATTLAQAGVDFGVHPLQTFVGDEEADAFRGIGCAVSGRSPQALAIAQGIARCLGAHPFEIADEQRAGYHAAASMASNFVVTLLGAAAQLAGATGLPPEDARMLLAPLVHRTVRNWAELGAQAALTGPIARGDTETVERQREAVAQDAPDLLVLFDALCVQTGELAATAGAVA